MKRLMLALVATMLAAVVLAACSPPTETAPTEPAPAAPATTNDIQGIVWQWETLTDTAAGSSMDVDNPEVYTIVFNVDGTTEGQADCNTFTGTYSQEGGFFITVRPDVMAACDLGTLDQHFLISLGDVVAGGPDGGGGLTLQTAGGAQSMLFSNGGSGPITEE